MASLHANLNAQENQADSVKNILRINFVNPALEYELKTSNSSVITGAAGIGYSGSYRELELSSANGLVYIISPFVDIQHKWYYNRNKRVTKDKSVKGNAGNYFSLRGITRFSAITENVTRTDNLDFAVGPTWGIQRNYGKIHFLLDFGPQFYFDAIGNSGFFPLMVQINVGLNLQQK
ncbi:MAG: hypothetical protein AAGL29_14915 [Bacteroidota bacterium]